MRRLQITPVPSKVWNLSLDRSHSLCFPSLNIAERTEGSGGTESVESGEK